MPLIELQPFLPFVNKFEKIYENSPNRVDIMVKSVIFKVNKGRKFSQNTFKAGIPYSECWPGVVKHMCEV